MQAVDSADFGYQVEAISDRAGAVIYRYTVYQSAPKKQQLLYGFELTREEAERIAATYTEIAFGRSRSPGCAMRNAGRTQNEGTSPERV